MMEFAPIISVAILLSLVGGSVAFWYRYSNWGQLYRTRRVPIREARDGQPAKIVGRLRQVEEPLRAPLTGRPCAYFKTHVQQRPQSSGKSSSWKTLITETGCAGRFIVEDESGKALVKTADASVLLDLDTQFNSGLFRDAPPELEAYLNRHGYQSQGIIFNKRIRYDEGVLEEGELVAVLGLCHLEPDPDPGVAGHGYRDRPLRPRLAAGPGLSLLISDRRRLLR